MSEWKEVKLGEISFINMGQSPDSKYYNNNHIGIPLIQGNADIKDRKSIKRVWTTLPTKLCEEGDILMTVRAPVGFVGISSSKSCLGRGVCGIKPFSINKRYLFHMLISKEDSWKKFEQGSTFTAVGSKEIFNFKLFINGSVSEQQRIAKIVDTCDKVIEQTQSAIAKYKSIKQGMLQDLFTRGLDLKGRLRPGYEEAPELYKESELGWIPKEWEVKRLGEIAPVNPPTTIPSFFSSKTQVSFLRMEDVSNDGFIINNRSVLNENVRKRGFTLFQENDILFAKITPCMENGKGALATNLFNGIGFGSTEFHVLRPLDLKSVHYVYFLSVSSKFRLKAGSQMTGSAGQQRVPTMFLENYKIAAPQLTEQLEIGVRLKNIDCKIRSEESLLNKYQSITRGLMGDLLGGKEDSIT